MSSGKNPVVLMYHSISVGSSPLKTSPALFLEQMEWLKRNASVVSLAELVASLEQATPLPPRAVVLTFDDGFSDFHSEAAPILKRLGLPATVFLPTAFCGKTNGWPGQPGWVEQQPLMGWEMIRELAEEGFTFGAHSVSHPVLTELSASDLERELVQSRSEVESRTGRKSEFFCYPYGRWNPGVREAVRQHYRGACSTAAGLVTADSDVLALPRVDAHYVRSPVCFRSVFSPAFRVYLGTRRLIRRVRRQPEGYLATR
jgi:peptidoglycan/xylan/chitin deacetylase (PgdA/CDA1 family)